MQSDNPNLQGVSEQELLNNLYRLLGEKVFKEMQSRDESIPAEAFLNNLMDSSFELCTRISDSINRIEEASKPKVVVPEQTEKVSQLSQGKKCPKCNTVCDDDSNFCSECGFKWPVIAAVPPVFAAPQATPAVQQPIRVPKALFCGNCGTKLDDDSIFCTNCGHKVDD